jgi:hypothetical protein
VWNSCRDQLFHKWNSTEALVFRVEQWNSVLLFLHQLCVRRMKTVIDSFVSKEQLGFVPKRHIAEATPTHLTKLIQNYLDDKIRTA